jgi:hypothetical protein
MRNRNEILIKFKKLKARISYPRESSDQQRRTGNSFSSQFGEKGRGRVV